MSKEKLVPRTEVVTNLRPYLQDLADSTSILRIFRDREKITESCIPLKEDRIIKVYGITDYDPLSSNPQNMIPESRKRAENGITSITITPKLAGQHLTFYWSEHNSTTKRVEEEVKVPDILSIGGKENRQTIKLSNGVNYSFFHRLKNVHNPFRDFMQHAQDFNLEEFGWGYY
ncbi:hypothetical protein GOV14_03325 [Candidatus Pacearchaeota archaeon]|nr:hypothetical protein [Candidatus Pacearchaeota archaeon]